MWFKPVVIIFLFWLLAVFQNSFFAHFDLMGAVPNLVFIMFFLLVFFEKPSAPSESRFGNYYHVVFYALVDGLFLDFLSYSYLGVSVILLLIIGFLIKSSQSMLRENGNIKFPFVYFLPLFFVGLLAYEILLDVFLNKFNAIQVIHGFNQGFFTGMIYNLIIATAAFYICKMFLKEDYHSKQLKLFLK